MIPQQMTFELLLNPSVREKDELRLSKQARAIYELLRRGPVRTSELATIGLQYNARINEVRHAVIKLGLMIDQQEGEGGENQYRLVELQQSVFWRKVKQKGEQWKWL